LLLSVSKRPKSENLLLRLLWPLPFGVRCLTLCQSRPPVTHPGWWSPLSKESFFQLWEVKASFNEWVPKKKMATDKGDVEISWYITHRNLINRPKKKMVTDKGDVEISWYIMHRTWSTVRKRKWPQIRRCGDLLICHASYLINLP